MQDTDLAERFRVRYDGGGSESGTMDARSFGLSIIGIYDTLRGLANEFGAQTSPQVRIEAEFERGSFIAEFIITWPLVERFVLDNAVLFDAFMKLFGAITAMGVAVGGIPTWIIILRKSSAEMRTAQANERTAKLREQMAREQLSDRERTRREREINQLRADAAAYMNGARDSELEPIARFAKSVDGQIALQRMAGPLMHHEASNMQVIREDARVELTIEQMSDNVARLKELAMESRAIAGSPSLGEDLDTAEADVQLLSAQFDGNPKGWRLRMDDKVINATIRDAAFLEAAASNKIQLTSGTTLHVTLRKRGLSPRSTAYDVLKVVPL